MASLKTIKKDRFDIVLKGKGITIQKLADNTGYLRPVISRAVNNGRMSEAMHEKISRCLDVSPDFLTGKEALVKIKDNKLQDFKNNFGNDLMIELISGYLVPNYLAYLLKVSIIESYMNLIDEEKVEILWEEFPTYKAIEEAFWGLGEAGVYVYGRGTQHFGSKFILNDFNYLVAETHKFMEGQVRSILSNDDRYQSYRKKEAEERAEQSETETAEKDRIELFRSMVDVIEPAEDPDS